MFRRFAPQHDKEFVIPAKAGIHLKKKCWIPAFAGMTKYFVWELLLKQQLAAPKIS